MHRKNIYDTMYGNIFPYIFIFFILSGYIISPTPTWAITFYAILLPITFFLSCTNKNMALEAFKNKAFFTSFIMIIWFLLTISWGVNQPAFNINKYISRSVVNLIFLLTATYFFSHNNPKWKKLFFRYFPYAVFINIVLSIAIFYGVKGNPLDTRLIGWAEARHPILGSLVILTGFCISFYQTAISQKLHDKTIYGAVCFGCVCFVFLTQSRGPILTLLTICGVFCLLSGKSIRWITLSTITAILLIFGLNDSIHSFVIESITRNPWRVEIWLDAWKYIQNAPIIGNGLASINTFGSIEQKFPHSIYVSSAFYGGFVGLALLLALFGQIAMTALKTECKNTKALHLGLLCIPVVGGLTDLAQVSKSPGELWYILWLPITIIIGYTIQQNRDKASR